MAHSEICPICSGNGKIADTETSAIILKTCHGCGGFGWITVEDFQKKIDWNPKCWRYSGITQTIFNREY
jgi:DnaJ-class molecular chaperone